MRGPAGNKQSEKQSENINLCRLTPMCVVRFHDVREVSHQISSLATGAIKNFVKNKENKENSYSYISQIWIGQRSWR